MAVIESRYIGNYYGSNTCYDNNNNPYYCTSSWSNWGRWVLLGILIISTLVFFFLFSCLTARRRRRQGTQPYYGTGWAAGRHGPATYNPNYQSQQQPHTASAHTAAPNYQQGGYYGQNQGQGYYGGQQTGTELRQPETAYRGGDNVYEPPPGPPPAKR